jgi:nicotinamidase/pyrazinamidase
LILIKLETVSKDIDKSPFHTVLYECKMPTALIIVDPQLDFCPGGALAVAGGDEVMPVINRIREQLRPSFVAMTKDWHPYDHISFVDNNPGSVLFTKRADGQMMWPAHCVQGSRGAQFHPALLQKPTDVLIQKGTLKDVDSYSGFGSEGSIVAVGEALRMRESTPLARLLDEAHITEVYVVGLAFDYCVAATAKDSAICGYRTTVIRNATRAVSADSAAVAEAEMLAAGVQILDEFMPPPSTCGGMATKIRKERWDLRAKQALERVQLLERQKAEKLAQRAKEQLSWDEFYQHRRQDAAARTEAVKQREEALEKLQQMKAQAEALGLKVVLKVELPPLTPSRPLTDWQLFMKRVGKVLSDAGVEIQPGNRDVKLLAVFCSEVKRAAWLQLGHPRGWYPELTPIADEKILALARTWPGRYGLDDEKKNQWWAASVGV